MAVGLGKSFPVPLPSSSSTRKEQRDRRGKPLRLGPIAQVLPADMAKYVLILCAAEGYCPQKALSFIAVRRISVRLYLIPGHSLPLPPLTLSYLNKLSRNFPGSWRRPLPGSQ